MRHCDFCNNNKYKILYKNNWNLVKCSNCGFIYTNPIPENLGDYYTEDYFKDERHKDSFYDNEGELILDNIDYSNRIRLIENFVEKRGGILEIGAARGAFLKNLESLGWHVNGVELSEDAVKKAKKYNNLNLYCGDFLDYNVSSRYDVICMYQTLEHLEHPKQTINKALEFLNDNGLLVIEVPNFNSWDIKWSKQQKELVYDLPRHLNHFTPKFLQRELVKIGFEVIYIDRYYPNFILKLFNRRNNKYTNNNISTKKIKTEEESLYKISNSWKVKFLNYVSVLFPGWRFTIVAKKNNE